MGLQTFSFFSGALYARKVCQVYLPPSYDQSDDKRYPVIYLLHGMYGDETSWTVKGNAVRTIEDAFSSGKLRESIIVMPNDGGYGHGTFYVNWYDGTGRFEDYFLYDLVASIDREFRTVADASRRFVGGLSMGGFGAFILALRNPGIFGAASSLAGALTSASTLPKEALRSEIPRLIGPVHGPYARELDPYLLAAQLVREPNRPRLHFSCGLSDSLYPLNAAFKALLDQIGYDHDYTEYEGDHDWDFFGGRLPETLAFFEQSFAALDLPSDQPSV